MHAATWRNEMLGRLIDEIPSGVMVIDPALNVVDHNRAFEACFGTARGRTCYSITKDRDEPCDDCHALEVFRDGRPRTLEQTGIDARGREVHYLVNLTPIPADADETNFVAAITTDLTAARQLQSEYQALFEKVPCFVALINRDHRVVKGNELFRRTFGEPTGERCYRLFKRRAKACRDCPVDRTFEDGQSHMSHHMGMNRDGKPVPYLVFTTPLSRGDEKVSHVMEMALDLTEHRELEERLSQANVLRHALVENSLDCIVVFDDRQRIQLVNRATEKLLGRTRDQLIGRKIPRRAVPKELHGVLSGKKAQVVLHETRVADEAGNPIPVRLVGFALRPGGRFAGAALIAQDLREIKQLEHEKLEAERLAAVGQTVAGLAHGIKNILTGLEGGMYVTSSGLKKGDQDRVRQGWEMLERNMGRISDLTRNLLAFSRGEVIDCREIRPASVAREVVQLFRDGASRCGIEVVADVEEVAPAWMDPDALHSCLSNLVSNAIDACQISGEQGLEVRLRLREEGSDLVFEVIDNGCGMDYEIKRKVFTSFFTTKGRGGTGLGLLLTRKIAQQHGGTVNLSSEPGKGTTFELRFPRHRLPKPKASKEIDHD
jgi:PAS domain S-box-containing protein